MKLLKSKLHFLMRLRQDQRGAVALTFLLTSTIMLGGAFGAIDLIRHNVAQGRLQNALDAAVISAGRNLANRTQNPTETEHNAWVNDARNFFRSNMPDGFLGSTVSTADLTVDYEPDMSGDYQIGELVSMSVQGNLPLISTGFMKITSFPLGASNQALRRTRSDLEVVLVVDGSGSMDETDSGSSKTRMQHLKDASNLLVDMVMGAAEANENSRTFIGVVPFTHVVNVGNNSVTRSWLTSGPTGWRDSRFVTDGIWAGCITEPRPVNNRPIADVAPANNGPGHFRPLYRERTADLQITRNYPHTNATRLAATFTPTPLGYRMPRGPSTNVDDGNYVVPVRRTTSSWFGTNYYLRVSFITNPGMCDDRREVRFLSRNQTAIKTYIDRLHAEGGTAVPAGLLWGWRMLHPAWSGQWGGETVDLGIDGSASMPRPSHPDLTKVMILLTDGANSVAGNLSTNEGFTYSVSYRDTNTTERTLRDLSIGSGDASSHGITDHNSLNDSAAHLTPSGGSSTAVLDTFTRQLCTNIKNPDNPYVPGGIRLYTIALGPASDAGLMQDCASRNGFYDSTNVNDLSAAFESIAGDLMELRLTK